MSLEGRISAEIKVQAVEDYLAARKGSTQIREELGIRLSTFQAWLRKYETQGAEGLLPRRKFSYYPASLKEEAVRDYLEGGGSLDAMCRKYRISSHAVLQGWIKLYNDGHRDFRPRRAQEEKNMTKGRKVTYEEKLQITQFCIEHENDYYLACEQYRVTYQQIYSWVRKYRSLGPDGLVDRRGKRKDHIELNEEEKSALQMRQLEAENRRLKMENDFLKKLNELERGREAAANIKPYRNSAKKKDIP